MASDMIRQTLLAVASAATFFASSAHASDVEVYLPGDWLSEQVDRQFDATLSGIPLPGTLSWNPASPGVRLRRIGNVLGFSADLQYQQVFNAGRLMFNATLPAALSFEVAFTCQGVVYAVDARNVQVTVAGIVYTGPALSFIESSVEAALTSQMAALDEVLIDATTAYGTPMQSKCIAIAIDADAGLDYQFDVGCVEGTPRHERCLTGLSGSGYDFRCVNREWTVTASDCQGNVHPH
jgi:hypothetical protein